MGWEEGSTEKIALHAAVGAAVADGDVMAGASAAALNEALLPHLTKALSEAGLDGVLDKVLIFLLTHLSFFAKEEGSVLVNAILCYEGCYEKEQIKLV